MIRRIAMTALLALALVGCATYDSVNREAYRDGSYRGNYDGGYYSAPADGYGDYYYDRPEVVFSAYDAGYFGGPYAGFGFGSAWGSGFGYDPWFYHPWYGYRYPYYWHRPWHHHAVSVGIDGRDVQRPMQAAPVRHSFQPDTGSRTGGPRDGGRMRPRHPPR